MFVVFGEYVLLEVCCNFDIFGCFVIRNFEIDVLFCLCECGVEICFEVFVDCCEYWCCVDDEDCVFGSL